MKTRIIHTKIWKDDYFNSLNRPEKILFIFLLTNENINMCGIYEQNDKEILLWTDLTNDELIKAKKKFEQDGKFFFRKGWVKVANHSKYNNYGTGEKQKPALEKELSNIPEYIIDTSIDTSMDTRSDTTPILDINHKSKNINNNPIKQKQENIKQKEEIKEVMDYYNHRMAHKRSGRLITSSVDWEDNFLYWRTQFELDQIKNAINRCAFGWIWNKPDGSPVYDWDLNLLFRRKNRTGEKVNYIQQALLKPSDADIPRV